MNLLARRLGTFAAAAVVAAPLAALPATQAGASSRPSISAQTFGMHYLDPSHPNLVKFGAVRLFGGNAPTWADLQPQSTTQLSTNPAVNPVSAQLDRTIMGYARRHIQVLITLGMTPAWAASSCQHVRPYAGQNVDWGVQTCPPANTSTTGPWGKYVGYLASHYARYAAFEIWNEPSLYNGYNGSVATLAKLQASAYSVVHRYHGTVVTPSIPFTNGSPTNGYKWLTSFLKSPGGKSYDVLGVHLYPSDAAARGGYGPEWSVGTGLAYAKKAVAAAHAPNRPIWDTEHNVGRAPAGTGYGQTTAGAAAVARTFILAEEYKVARTFWYAADDRNWGGTWLESSNNRSLATPGLGYRTVEGLLVNKAAYGCSTRSRGANKADYTCTFGTTSGHKTLIALWTTGSKYTFAAPKGTSGYYSVTGSHGGASRGKHFTITSTPIYLTGSF